MMPTLLALLLLASTPAEARKSKGTLANAAADALADAMISAPADEEVCFSPEERCDVKLVKFVATSKVSLDIAIYDINLDSLVHQILLLSKKIPVRVVVDRKQAKGGHSLVNTLVQGGVNVRFGHQRGIMHNKFTIVDGRMIETGSFNHTNHASKANNENQVYLASRKIVARYVKRFEEIWAKGDAVN